MYQVKQCEEIIKGYFHSWQLVAVNEVPLEELFGVWEEGSCDLGMTRTDARQRLVLCLTIV